MRPEEMRAAIVEAMARAYYRADPDYYRDVSYDDQPHYIRQDCLNVGEACVTALETKLSEIGAKITVREEIEHAPGSGWYNVRWDAAPLTPWLKEDPPMADEASAYHGWAIEFDLGKGPFWLAGFNRWGSRRNDEPPWGAYAALAAWTVTPSAVLLFAREQDAVAAAEGLPEGGKVVEMGSGYWMTDPERATSRNPDPHPPTPGTGVR